MEELYTNIFRKFLSLKNRLIKKKNRNTGNQQAPQVVTQNKRPRWSTLLKIQLTIFDGDQLQWEFFKEIFQARVADDYTILSVFKLQHLLFHIKGKAARPLAVMELTVENSGVI